MSWVKLTDDNGGTYALEANPDPQNIKTVDEVNDELASIEAELLDVSKEPDQIEVQNDAKFARIDSLNNKKAELEALLAQWQ